MRWTWTRWCAALGLIALGACMRDKPTAPATYSFAGHVRLTGYFVNLDGQFAGTRVVGDADGIGVELLHGSQVVARTTTVGGAYRFSGLEPSAYMARSRVVGDIGDQTARLTITYTDVTADTLRLVARGDLHPVPNPFTDTTKVDFALARRAYVDVNVIDLAGAHIKNLLSREVDPDRRTVFWDGTNPMNEPVPGTYFWITLVSGGDIRAHLLVRNPPPPIAFEGSAPGRD